MSGVTAICFTGIPLVVLFFFVGYGVVSMIFQLYAIIWRRGRS